LTIPKAPFIEIDWYRSKKEAESLLMTEALESFLEGSKKERPVECEVCGYR
jgi:hypothetical protein